MGLIEKYLPRFDFTSYEDFKANYAVTVPEGFNFAHDIVDEWGKLDPHKEALIWVNDALEEKHFTFAELSTLSNKAANLYRSLGIQKGDRVMLILKQRPQAWISILALHKLGAVVIPASFQLTPKDIVYRCAAANIKMITCVDDDEVINHLAAALPDCPTLVRVGVVGTRIPAGDIYLDFEAEMHKADAAFNRLPIDNADPMLIYFSSGTTGMPKMVLHDFTYPLGHITTAYYWQKAKEGQRHLTMSDSGWAKFAWGKIYGQWVCGAVIVAYDTEKFDAAGVIALINKLKLYSFCAPPTIYRFLIRADLSGCDFSTIKHISTAGEPLNIEVFNLFKQATGLEIREGFGQSESSVMAANFDWFEARPGSMGKPSPFYDIEIMDENLQSCEDGVVGNIVVRNCDTRHPLGLFREYWHDEAANAKSWRGGCYNTGDTAWRDSDGYLWFVGRSDDVIKCSGYRIGPFEVENALQSHPAVLESAVTAAPDPVRGQVVKATIVLVAGYAPTEELKKEIQDHVKKVTAPYKYPRIVEFVTALPKTVSGKIRRVEIREGDGQK